MREKQSSQEIARLQEAFSALIDQAGLRTRQEVTTTYRKHGHDDSKVTLQYFL